MGYSLKGRNVLITGGSRGLGALLCARFASEGCNIAINYNSSPEPAEKVLKEVESHGVKGVTLKADVSKSAECTQLVKDAIAKLGGLDIVIHNAGWTRQSRFGDLDALSEADWDLTYAINTKANLWLFKEAAPTFNANPDGGCYISTNSVAGLGPRGSSIAYSVSKAAALHLTKCLASTQGPKIRVNAVCPGLLLTEWGQTFPKAAIDAIINASALKQETMLDDTVEAFVMIAKNGSMTGESIRVDSGNAISG